VITNNEASVSLPAELLHAISQPAGGRVVLVTGAGCSVEAPTNLSLAFDCATKAHVKLVRSRGFR
jgi:hypothetical protein